MSMAASQRHSKAMRPRRFVIMGVSGCGKSSAGAALADRLAGVYIDGDDLHPTHQHRHAADGRLRGSAPHADGGEPRRHITLMVTITWAVDEQYSQAANHG
jgi:ABC-type transport system involved in cytochrome bd biosynthesis fused ATPase/permease subunit